MAEPIEELAVRLTAEGEEFLAEIDEDVEAARKKLEELSDAGEKMSDDLRAAGQSVRDFAVFMESSLEEAALKAESLGQIMGFTASEAVAAAQQIEAEIRTLSDETFARFIARAEELGVVLDEDVKQSVRAQLQVMAELRAGVDDAALDMGQFADELAEAAAENEEFASNTDGATKQVSRFDQEVSGLINRLAGYVSILALINKAQQIFNQAIADALELADVNFRLAAAVRAQQQAQGESAGTIQEWNKFAREVVDDFGRPLETTIRDVAASLNLMTTNMNLSGEEMQNLLRRSAALATRSGQGLQAIVTNLAQFVGTGRRSNEALIRLGITIDDTAIRSAALALGIRKSLDEMTDAELQAVRYQAVMEQTAFATGDAELRTETLAGRMDKANQQFSTASEILGNAFLPVVVELKETFAGLAVSGAQVIFLIQTLAVQLRGVLIGAFAGASEAARIFFNQLFDPNVGFDPDAIVSGFNDTFEFIQEQAQETLVEMTGAFDGMEDNFGDAADSAEEMESRISEAFNQAADAIEDATDRWEDGVEKAQQKLSDRLEDIERDFQDRLFDLSLDLNRDLADIDRDAARDRMQALREAQVEEIRAREDHARAVRELEISYLFDLEDAVRERDARQVLQLQRRFKQQRRKLDEEFNINSKRRKEDLAEELSDLEQRRIIRRQERIIAFQEEVEDLQRMRERRQADAQRQYERDLRDLRRNIERRLRLAAQGIEAELRLSHQGLMALYDQLNQAFGPGGFVEAFYRRYAAIVAQSGSVPSVAAGQGGFDELKYRRIQNRQRGGTLLATSPTLFQAGEGRPEIVDITPMSGGRQGGGFGGGAGGRVRIDLMVDASDKLMIETAEFVENDIADVVVSLSQGQRQSRGALR